MGEGSLQKNSFTFHQIGNKIDVVIKRYKEYVLIWILLLVRVISNLPKYPCGQKKRKIFKREGSLPTVDCVPKRHTIKFFPKVFCTLPLAKSRASNSKQ
jgi:hypothetical protein